jgi:diguanylate cyclase (GGDEF)-like protein
MGRLHLQRSLWYSLAGIILSLGAPTGLLILRELYRPRPFIAELASERLTYIYVLVATAAVLAAVGFALGRQADRLAALSATDPLTGLYNRRALKRHLIDEFRRAVRYRSPLSLLLVDVDRLKQVNDEHGHAAGDRVLRGVARAVADGLRQSDFGARWGGDEFAIVAPNTNVDAARHSAERLVARVVDAFRKDHDLPVTVSVGISTYEPDNPKHCELDSLVRAADLALYRAKESGRNRAKAA